MPKVSIIIPVYGVEKYIEICARSLFEQTLDDLEYIFIDDCSPDNSIDILLETLDNYPSRKSQVCVLKNERNRGLAFSRTRGLKAASADYVISCDPDDWVDVDIYRKMYEKAINTNSDIVSCNYISVKSNGDMVSMNLKTYDTPLETLYNYPNNGMVFTVWNRLVKRRIISDNNIYPIVDIGEDMNMMYRAYYFSNKICHIDIPLYFHLESETSITKNANNAYFDYCRRKNFDLLIEFTKNNIPDAPSELLNYLKFMAKGRLLHYSPPKISEWCHTYPECHKDIMRFRLFSFFHRLLLSVCCHSPYLMRIYLEIRK